MDDIFGIPAPLLFGQLADAQSVRTADPELIAQNSIAMLSAFLPRRTSLTRLGVPRSGTMSVRVRPC